MGRIADLLARGAIAPLRQLAYPLASAACALRALASASHAGKVLALAPPAAAPAGPAHGSGLSGCRVLITGGTGGLGLLLARWLAGGGCGGRVSHITLVSRTGRAPDGLADLESCGVSVTVLVGRMLQQSCTARTCRCRACARARL